jgi:imidazoleglycerol-phosphate dehydratase/histidinol-phosphatase
MRTPALIIDRDGTLIKEPLPSRQIDSLEKFELLPGVLSSLREILNFKRYDLYLVTNQDGLGTLSFPTEHFTPYQDLLLSVLKSEGIFFKEILIDRKRPEEADHADLNETRKPGIGLMLPYLDAIDLDNSYVIGDRDTDVQLANNLGVKAILLGDASATTPAFQALQWKDIVEFIKKDASDTLIVRKTKETTIEASFSPWGSGYSKVETGIGFLDHMLTLMTYYAKMNLSMAVQGDLYVDEHHTTEDVALVLGQALDAALGDRKGISRFGFTAPMDEALATCALDFSGRPELVWNVAFTRERLGDLPTEMIKHFFKSFAYASRTTLHVSASGENEHHIAESIFKCIGLALRQALRLDPLAKIPSTKGVI